MLSIAGVAIVSLAIQLTGGFIKLLDFWGTVRDAPGEVNEIVTDLKLLSSILNELVNQNNPSPHVKNTLIHCNNKVNVSLLACCLGYSFRPREFPTANRFIFKLLLSIVREFEPNFSCSKPHIRLWNRFKTANKSKKLKRFRDSVQEAKITLMLALVPQL